MALQKAMVSSKSNEWETPQALFDELNDEFHFTLDPCATKDNAKCPNFCTIADNGLSRSWSGEVVFMNPPYGGHTREWIEKAWYESHNGAIIVCLIVSATDRSYWHDYIFPHADEIRWLRGRVTFGEAKSTAPFASAIVVFSGKNNSQKQGYQMQRQGKWQYILI